MIYINLRSGKVIEAVYLPIVKSGKIQVYTEKEGFKTLNSNDVASITFDQVV